MRLRIAHTWRMEPRNEATYSIYMENGASIVAHTHGALTVFLVVFGDFCGDLFGDFFGGFFGDFFGDFLGDTSLWNGEGHKKQTIGRLQPVLPYCMGLVFLASFLVSCLASFPSATGWLVGFLLAPTCGSNTKEDME